MYYHYFKVVLSLSFIALTLGKACSSLLNLLQLACKSNKLLEPLKIALALTSDKVGIGLIGEILIPPVSLPIIFTDLAADNPPLPGYLAELELPIKQIPNAMTGNLDQQILELKQHLHKLSRRNRLIFAGGWRDACLRRTVNQIAFRNPRLIVNETGLSTATDATFKLDGYRDRQIKVAADWENVL